MRYHQPFVRVDGKRYAPVSVNGYDLRQYGTSRAGVGLVRALLDLLADAWKPGHAVPARRSVAQSLINRPAARKS
jgi:hypothetical protein